MTQTHRLAAYIQRFFTERLVNQLHASRHTVAGYRDTFRLLLRFVSRERGRVPTDLLVADVNADTVGAFLTFIEEERGCSARSRNTRLSAIRSFFKYVAMNEPELLHHCQRILAMPPKRYEKRTVDFLTRAESEAMLDAPDRSTWHGRRDRTLLAVALQTGLRVSELTGLTCGDVELGTGAHVRCLGKGRKERATPLRKDSIKALRSWLAERGGTDADPLFPSATGERLSRDAVERLVRKHATTAAKRCPSLAGKRVTPHVLRHSAAMALLQNGVDRTVIALWLGHESVETTQMYVHADMTIKEYAMARTTPAPVKPGRFRPDDELLAFLEAL
jgi:site-specific recombinase XerD